YHEDRTVITRVNGQESVEIEIYKEADANVLTVAAAVRDAMLGTPEQRAYVASLAAGDRAAAAVAPLERRRLTDFLAHQLAPGATLQLLGDQSVFIRNSIDEVK